MGRSAHANEYTEESRQFRIPRQASGNPFRGKDAVPVTKYMYAKVTFGQQMKEQLPPIIGGFAFR